MPGPWTTTAAAKELVRTQMGGETLDARWDGIVPNAVDRAWQAIQTTLLGKGYTLAQMDAWDFRAAHNLDLAAVKALINGGSLTPYDVADLLEREKRLLAEIAALPALSVNGVLVYPAATTADGGGSQIAGGLMDQSGWSVGRDTTF